MCERYAQLVVEGQGDTIDNLNAYRRKVARQALDERADRLDELRASGMAPAEAAELLLADGPTRRPTPAPPRPLGDPLCDDCRGSGMAYTDMSGPVPSGPVIRCSCDPPDPDRPRSSADPWDPWSDLPELGKVTG